MKSCQNYWRPALLTLLLLLAASSAVAQVPRAVFGELGSATW